MVATSKSHQRSRNRGCCNPELLNCLKYALITAILAVVLLQLRLMNVCGVQEEITNERPKESVKASKKGDNSNYHVLFSTGCTPFQEWQSYVFFYHVWKSGQQGDVTRIVSGCNEQDTAEMIRLHEERIVKAMGQERFRLHFTPDYADVIGEGKRYHFVNKPYGIRHFMEHGLGFPNPNTPLGSNDTIFIILDPDQLLLRPLVGDYSHEGELWRTEPTSWKVSQGHPIAQEYGLAAWYFMPMMNMTHILGSETAESPARTITYEEVDKHYIVGSPYLLVGSDLYKLVIHWSGFMPAIYDLTNGNHICEMFAYVTAAMHVNLPHLQATAFMLSDVSNGGGEAWPYIDDKLVSPTDMCQLDFPHQPRLLHFCQEYLLGPHYFNKYFFPADDKNPAKSFLSCEHPLFREPELNLFDLYNDSITMDGVWVDLSDKKKRKRHAFFLCQIIPRLNQAFSFFKQQHCDKNANFEKTFLFERTQKD